MTPIRFAVLCAPDSSPDPDPISRRFPIPIRPPIGRALRCLLDHRFATRKRGECEPMRAGGGRCGAGCGGMRRGNGESQNRAMLRMGRRLTRHPQVGSCGDTERGVRVCLRQPISHQQLRFSVHPSRLHSFVNRKIAVGVHRVNTLICWAFIENRTITVEAPRV